MKLPSPEEMLNLLRQGDRISLARAISWAESPLPEHISFTGKLLGLCAGVTGETRRIGITGVPGVGKSTFINSFGLNLISSGSKVAVLAIDPSSNRSGGSILGDKTRMAELAAKSESFIRPSPAGGFLGGVNAGTRSAIILCEAAGYDTVLIETVGVGQSEMAVEGMTDFLLLLMLPGAGDELQGIKRGIMEIADCIAINKAEGDMLGAARAAKVQYTSALKLFPPHPAGWDTPVVLCSALEGTGISELSEIVTRYFNHTIDNGYYTDRRREQEVKALHELLREMLVRVALENDKLKKLAETEEQLIRSGQSNAPSSLARLAEVIRKVS